VVYRRRFRIDYFDVKLELRRSGDRYAFLERNNQEGRSRILRQYPVYSNAVRRIRIK